MAQALTSVTVALVGGLHGPRYTVTTSAGVETLCTANAGAGAWAKVEEHVRHAMDQLTVAEQLARTLQTIVEEQGIESPAGALAYEALIAAGMD